MSNNTLIRLRDAAHELGVSKATLRRHIEAGKLGCAIIGLGKIKQHVRFTRKDLDVFIEQQRREHTQQLLVSPAPMSLRDLSKLVLKQKSRRRNAKSGQIPAK